MVLSMQNNVEKYAGIVRKFEENDADELVHLPHHQQSDANQGGSRVMSVIWCQLLKSLVTHWSKPVKILLRL